MKLNRGSSAILRILGSTLLLTCLTCLGAEPITPGHSLPNTTIHGNEFSTLLISQAVSYSSGSISNSITANLGQLTSSGSQIDVIGPNNGDSAIASSLQLWIATNYGTQTQGAIVAAAKNYLSYGAPSIIASIKSALAATTAKSASYQYSQTVQVTGITGNSQLVWTLYIDPLGNAIYGDPIVIPGTPVYISVTYTPLAVGQGLPQGWQYPNAGVLQYQVIQISNGQPVTAMQTINVGGAYDAPAQVIGAAPIDPDAGLKCLMNKTSSGVCPQGYADIVSLIGNASASYAFVNYVRALNPVYISNGSGTVSPQMTIDYNLRIIHVASCSSGSYENIGTYGYALNQQTDTFFAMPTGQYSLIKSSNLQSQSPTQSFDLFKSINSSSMSTIGSQVIDFYTAGNPLVSSSSLPSIAYLAPLTYSGSLSNQVLNWTSASWYNTEWNDGGESSWGFANSDSGSLQFIVNCNFNSQVYTLTTNYIVNGYAVPINNPITLSAINQGYSIYNTWSGGPLFNATLDASNNLWISSPYFYYTGISSPICTSNSLAGTSCGAKPTNGLILSNSYSAWTSQVCVGLVTQQVVAGFNLISGQPITATVTTDPSLYGYYNTFCNSNGGG